jgi:superfamily II DNA or RNA helicase
MSKGYLYYTSKLENTLKKDILNTNGILNSINLKYDNEENINLNNNLKDESNYELRYYQIEAINKLNENWDGIKLLSLPCGVGKTIIFSKHVKDKQYKNIIIISPLKIHAKQNLKRIKNFLPEYNNLLLDSDSEGSTNFDDLIKILDEKSIISTTFESAENLLSRLFQKNEENELCLIKDLNNSIIIIDEAHNLINKNELIDIIKLFNKVLLVTATPPSCMYDMLGCDLIYQYSFRKAIEDKYICDYQIYLPIILNNNIMIEIPNEIIKIDDTNYVKKCLYLLNGILQTGSKKCICYFSSKDECNIFIKNLDLVNKQYHYLNLWTNTISSDNNEKSRLEILDEFEKKNDSYNFLCSIRILNEGIDIPCCDSIFISNIGDNINDITTVQRICRANRILSDNPYKIANCFLWTDDLNKIINIFNLLKNNDIEFTKKIKILNSNYTENYDSETKKKELIVNENINNFIKVKCKSYEEIWEFKKELLFNFCNVNKRIPIKDEEYENINLEKWYDIQKKYIKSKECNFYEKLSINEYLKNDIDYYLGKKIENKNIKNFNFECKRCGYKSLYVNDMKKHLERKKKCNIKNDLGFTNELEYDILSLIKLENNNTKLLTKTYEVNSTQISNNELKNNNLHINTLDISKNNKNKNFECEHCKNKLFNKQGLERHIKICKRSPLYFNKQMQLLNIKNNNENKEIINSITINN